MEAEGAKRIFLRSEQHRGLLYTTYVGDGDSSSFSAVVRQKPYREKVIVKKECVGHVQKGVGSRLRELKNNLVTQSSQMERQLVERID